jgi:hypothetical protein
MVNEAYPNRVNIALMRTHARLASCNGAPSNPA